MKTVWVIEEGEYSDYHIVGIFETEDSAREVQQFIKSGYVSEWSLNPATDQLRAGLERHHVQMYRDGRVFYARKDFNIEDRDAWIAPDGRLIDTVWAASYQHAIKIVNEKRTKMIAEGLWL